MCLGGRIRIFRDRICQNYPFENILDAIFLQVEHFAV